MRYRKCENVVCFENIKGAALYFDHVLPIAFKSLQGRKGRSFFEIPEHIPLDAFREIVFSERLLDPFTKCRTLDIFFDAWTAFIKKIGPYRTIKCSSIEDDYSDIKKMYIENTVFEDGSSIRQEFAKYAKSLGVEYASVFLGSKSLKSQTQLPQYLSLSLLDVPLIDTARASWEQIIEIRKDVGSRNKLRNLRLFLYDNYREKNLEFVEDDLYRRIDEYQRARKKHGFEIVLSSMQALISSKNLQAALGGGLAAALLGGAASGITTGILIEVSGIIIEIAKKHAEFKDLTDGHDLAFIIRVRKKLNKRL